MIFYSPGRSPSSLIRLLSAACVLMLVAACGSAPAGPGEYRVRSGDTLLKISHEHGRSVQELVRWNNLSNSDRLAVGQLLRVAPPSGRDAPGVSKGETKGSSRSARAGAAAPARDARPAQRTEHAAPAGPVRRMNLIWPASGKVEKGFNGSTVKGLRIVNAAGTPVVAAAAGTVVYAGHGLRGYGNLVIIRHDRDFLTIYAHNRSIAIKSGQHVSQGQKIAEMGRSDSTDVQLYFELRYDGMATNPVPSLPAR